VAPISNLHSVTFEESGFTRHWIVAVVWVSAVKSSALNPYRPRGLPTPVGPSKPTAALHAVVYSQSTWWSPPGTTCSFQPMRASASGCAQNSSASPPQ
jgi:hypothetical protein